MTNRNDIQIANFCFFASGSVMDFFDKMIERLGEVSTELEDYDAESVKKSIELAKEGKSIAARIQDELSAIVENDND